MDREERIYFLAFSCAPGIGPKRFSKLISFFGNAKDAWKGGREEFGKIGIGRTLFSQFDAFRRAFDVHKYVQKLKEVKVDFVTLNDKEYPSLLKTIDEAPIVLFVKGEISPMNSSKILAVVGTRKMTSYGREVTEQLVSGLVAEGFVIVSGLALGIDAVAHKVAVERGGTTIAVLGCGVDCCYPKENEWLYQKILEGGGLILSQFPLGQKPSRGTFPARNRVISGISQGVIVTEAGADSGALITAHYAKEQGKPIFAVPGLITSHQSKGALSLLKGGAFLVQSVEDVFQYFGGSGTPKKAKELFIDVLDISPQEKDILRLLQQENLHIDDVSRKTGLPMPALNQIISFLELQGLVRNLGEGVFGLSINQ